MRWLSNMYVKDVIKDAGETLLTRAISRVTTACHFPRAHSRVFESRAILVTEISGVRRVLTITRKKYRERKDRMREEEKLRLVR